MHDLLRLRQFLFCNWQESPLAIPRNSSLCDEIWNTLECWCLLLCQTFSERIESWCPHPLSDLLLCWLESWLHNYISTLHDLYWFNMNFLAGASMKDVYFWICRLLDHYHTAWAWSSKCYNPNISPEANMYIWGEHNFWPLLVGADLGQVS